MKNIPERFMVQGVRLDTGEVVAGYYCRKTRLKPSKIDVGDFIVIVCGTGDHKYTGFIAVDPATIEPVAVDVWKEAGLYFCPNCKQDFSSDPDYKWNYCPECGQRLAWE